MVRLEPDHLVQRLRRLPVPGLLQERGAPAKPGIRTVRPDLDPFPEGFFEQSADVGRAADRREGRPTWRLILSRELFELWVGGKAIVLVIIYSILLGMTAFVTSNNSELELIPPKELVFMRLTTAIGMGLFIGLITGADSISGERERGTLEALL